MNQIDLHCHSTHSDGQYSPIELVRKAKEVGVDIIALTDHDTLSGLPEFTSACAEHQLNMVTGIELSVRWKKNDIHILGYHFDPEAVPMQALVESQQNSRVFRAKAMAAKFEELGFPMMYEKAVELAGHERIGRPHFAQVLFKEQRVKDIQHAFRTYLTRGKPAYVSTPWVSVEEAVEGVVQAGGWAVIAHPLKYDLTRTRLREFIDAFKEAGGQGMEVVSGDMMTNQIQEMASLCSHYDLFASTGSDFHGTGHSRTSLGRQAKLPPTCKPIWEQWNFGQDRSS